MRDEGWIGNQNDRMAAKGLFNTMASHKKVFRNVGNNQWELAVDVKQPGEEGTSR
jgi:hypothetical protein